MPRYNPYYYVLYIHTLLHAYYLPHSHYSARKGASEHQSNNTSGRLPDAEHTEGREAAVSSHSFFLFLTAATHTDATD